jgi:hypothetical protein
MGETFHYFISPFSFIMGVWWFSAFIALGLLARRVQFPIKFSAVPLVLLLVLSFFRIVFPLQVPGAIVLLSDRVYPMIFRWLQFEVLPFRLLGFPINLFNLLTCVWVGVAVYLSSQFLYGYIHRRLQIKSVAGQLDLYPEAGDILAELVDGHHTIKTCRSDLVSSPIVIAAGSCMVFPDINFSKEELRPIIKHEWKHLIDRDDLSDMVVHLASRIFWWHPLVRSWSTNCSFAKELKCDMYAVADEEEFDHYLQAHTQVVAYRRKRLENSWMGCPHQALQGNEAQDQESQETKDEEDKDTKERKLTGKNKELLERLQVLKQFLKTPLRQRWVGTLLTVVVCVLFVASYMVVVLPAFWESPDVPVSAEDFHGEAIFRVGETFFIDNGNGTFSFYVDGQFLHAVEREYAHFRYFRQRSSDEMD